MTRSPSPEVVRSISNMLKVDIDHAAKITSTICLATADTTDALTLAADLLRPIHQPTDADITRICDQLFDHFRAKWWLPARSEAAVA